MNRFQAHIEMVLQTVAPRRTSGTAKASPGLRIIEIPPPTSSTASTDRPTRRAGLLASAYAALTHRDP